MSEKMYHAVMMKAHDSVATALTDIPAGTTIEVAAQGQTFTVQLKEAIEFGHKFAVKAIKNGEDIMKYGEVIGIAIADIEPGEHVHIQNLEGKRGRGDKIGTAN